MGDMFYFGLNFMLLVCVYGVFVCDQEVYVVVQDWKVCGCLQYVDGIIFDSESEGGVGGFDGVEELDLLFDQVVQFVIEKCKVLIFGVQCQFCIGYNCVVCIIEQMEVQGIVSEQGYNGNCEVLVLLLFD